jgi:hypothetical protein
MALETNGFIDVDVREVVVSPEFQMRVKLDSATVAEYSECIKASKSKWVFSTPCTVWRVGGRLILTDGFHRHAAVLLAGKAYLRCRVFDGTRTDALKAALGANIEHGLRRSNADKRRAVTVAIQDETLQKWSDNKLAELCGVSQPFVGQIRAELITVISSARESSIGADGKNRPANAEKAKEQREAIKVAIEKSPDASDREIAEQIGCDGKTVGKVRTHVQSSPLVSDPPSATTVLLSDPVAIPNQNEPPIAPAIPEPLTHIERLERLTALLKDEMRALKRIEGWAETKERCAAVVEFMRTYRRLGNEFEKFTTVGAAPKKTLFEADADIPEHLNTQEFLEAWASWWSDRKRRKLSVSDVTKRKQLKLLAVGDSEQATQIVLKAEESQWQGIPNNIWIPGRDGLWCDRVPPHADKDLLKKIKATPPKTGSYVTKDEETREQQKRRGRFVDDEE